MSLSRPAYTVTIKGHAGWEYTATQGVRPNLADPVQLADGLQFSWSLADDLIPAPFEPATCTFNLAAAALADLPQLNLDDIVTIEARRAAGAVYFNITGRITDPRISLDPHRRRRPVIAAITVTEIAADLNTQTLPPTDPFLGPNVGTTPIDWTIYAAKEGRWNVCLPDKWADSAAPLSRPAGWAAALESTDKLLTLAGTSDPAATSNQAAPAPPYPRISYHPEGPPTPGPGWLGTAPHLAADDPMRDFMLWMQPVTRHLKAGKSAPLELTTRPSPSGPIMTVRASSVNTGRGAAVLTLTGHHVTSPTTAIKNRATASDAVRINAHVRNSDGQMSESQENRYRPGVNRSIAPRVVDTGLLVRDSTDNPDRTATAAHRDAVSAAFMTSAADATAWTYPTLTVSTWTMTDEELDAAAPQFWPSPPKSGQSIEDSQGVKQVLIDDAASTVVTERFITGQLVGATLNIEGGRLSIDLQLAPGLQDRPSTNTEEVAAADLKGHSTYQTIDAAHTDKDLAAEIFKLVGAP